MEFSNSTPQVNNRNAYWSVNPSKPVFSNSIFRKTSRSNVTENYSKNRDDVDRFSKPYWSGIAFIIVCIDDKVEFRGISKSNFEMRKSEVKINQVFFFLDFEKKIKSYE